MFSVSVSVNRQNSIPQLQLLSRRLNRIPARLLLLLIGRADLDPGEEDHDGECRVEHHLVVAEVLKVAVLVRIINSQALQHAYFTLCVARPTVTFPYAKPLSWLSHPQSAYFIVYDTLLDLRLPFHT